MSKSKFLKNLKIYAVILIVAVLFLFLIIKMMNSVFGKMLTISLAEDRSTLYGDIPKEKRGLVAFGNQIEHDIIFGPSEKQNTVKDFLDAGFDPNYCLSFAAGWQYKNPLMLFNTAAGYSTYYHQENLIYPDVTVFNELIKFGADVNRYPYVWACVFFHDNRYIYRVKKEYKNNETTEQEMNQKISAHIIDSNRVLKLFLDAGADVNRKGNPLPFDKKYCTKITEKEIQRMFNSPEATSPLYEAIKKGIQWESQVDLLLEYGAQLDESCKKAAQESGDTAMIEKINKLIDKK